MARQETIFNLSPIIIHAKKAVNGGTSDIMSIAKREPIMVYDLNRNRSPKTNPINPETHSHNQLYAEASVGNIIPLRIQVKIDRKKSPINSRITFTEREPILRLADSKASAVAVQKIAVNKA